MEYRTSYWVCVVALTKALQLVVVRREHVPQESIHIIWPDSRARAFPDQWDLLCLFSVLSVDLYHRLWQEMTFVCSVCCDPCEKVGQWTMPDENCDRCHASFLCWKCHVLIDRAWVCFNCLKGEEWKLLTARQRRRAALAGLP